MIKLRAKAEADENGKTFVTVQLQDLSMIKLRAKAEADENGNDIREGATYRT